MSDSPQWITAHHVQRLHSQIIEKTGGSSGLRDQGLLQSAVDRPKNLHVHGETDLFKLAACYAQGVAKNHAFVDGNKRAGFLAAALFLKLNGQAIEARPAELHTEKMIGLAEGNLELEGFARHLQDHAQAISMDRKTAAQKVEAFRDQLRKKSQSVLLRDGRLNRPGSDQDQDL